MNAPDDTIVTADPTSAITDPERVRSVMNTNLLDTPSNASLDRLTRLASRILRTPVSLVSLITADEQILASSVGLAESVGNHRTPLEQSFCKFEVIFREPLVVDDSSSHPLVRDLPAARSGAVVAYLGVPLVLSDGHAIGSFCVFDSQPRKWQDDDIEVMRDLAASVVTEIEQQVLVTEAREARQQFDDLVNGIDAIVWEADAGSLQFTFVSQQAEAMLGYPIDRWLSKPDFWENLIHPDDRVRTKRACVAAVGQSEDHELEYRVVSASGETLWLRDNVFVVRDDTGAARCLRGVMVDITEQMESTAALQHSEELFRNAFEDAGTGLSFVSFDGYFLRVNRLYAQMLGYTVDELVGMNYRDITHPEDIDLSETHGSAVETEAIRSSGFEKRMIHKDGHVVWGHLTVSVVRDRDGTPIHHITQVQDITERKRAEAALQESEERFRSLVLHASDIICILDASGRFTYTSPSTARALGYEPESLLGCDAFSLIHPDDVTRMWQVFNAKASEIGNPEVPFRILHAGGEWRWMEAVGRTLYGTGGIDGTVINARDVTERVNATAAIEEAQARFQTLVEHIPLVVYSQPLELSSQDAPEIYMSPQLEVMLGYRPDEWVAGNLWIDVIHLDDREQVLAEDRRTNSTGDAFSLEYRMIARDGRIVWVRDEAVLLPGDGNRPPFWQGVLVDITAQKQADAALRESEERFRSGFENAATGMAMIDAKGRFLWVNPALCDMLGYTEHELLATDGVAITHSDDLAMTQRFVNELNRNERSSVRVEKRYVRKDGSPIWTLLNTSRVRPVDGRPDYYMLQIVDISDRKLLEAELTHQALHDVLTGLPNRALLEDRAEQALALSRRTGETVAILFLDLDNFKVVNDSLGHATGDHLLLAVSQMLLGCVREADTVARFGGDEMAILLTNLSGGMEAVEVAERVLAMLADPIEIGGRPLTITTSIGIAVAAPDDTPDALLRHADVAMYRAKTVGRNRYEVFDAGMHASALQRLQMEHDLRRAIEYGELVLHYQPSVSLPSSEVVGVEALVRWQHPERGMVSPGEFIPLAEESGLIAPLGSWVLRAACRQAREWIANGWPDASISVNLSARQFRQPGLVQEIETILDETGLTPQHLTLELTETAVMDDAGQAIERLQALKALGVQIAIDDFGTGYSSLAYLQQFPVDALKIDRRFVAGLGANDTDAAIVRSILTLAHSLGLRVVAEGVEEAEQVTLLRALGCERAQGFYFSRPRPAAEILPLLHQPAPAR